MVKSLKIPAPFKQSIKRSPLWLRHESKNVNVYHCCVHKTASQWFQALFSDRRVYRFSGLELCPNGRVERGNYYPIVESSPPFPEKTIAGSLHISYPNFEAIQTPHTYKAFFILRDPRDLVISYYFSTKVSHVKPQDPQRLKTFEERRQKLSEIDIQQGIFFVIDEMKANGMFDALASWISAPDHNSNVRLYRFEDLTQSDNLPFFQDLFQHCDIKMPDSQLKQLLQDRSFERITGRKQGEESVKSHLRKGTPNQWKDYFTQEISDRFYQVTGDLTQQLGYGQ